MSSLSKKGLKQKKPLRTLSHPDPCIPKSTKGNNTGISYWSRGGIDPRYRRTGEWVEPNRFMQTSGQVLMAAQGN